MILEDVILGFGLGSFTTIVILTVREVYLGAGWKEESNLEKDMIEDEKVIGKTERGKFGDKDKARTPDLP